MSASDSLDTTVLIVGAGPVGILTGLLLNRLGISFVIVERRSSLHNAPQAHVISSRSLEICRAVGVDDMKIRSLGPKLEDTATIRWVDTLAGRDLGVFDMRRRPEDIGRMLTSTPTPSTNLSQDQFERVLFARLSEVAGSDVLRFEHGWEGVKEETDSEGSVTYLSSISTDSGPLELRSRYLIGADGNYFANTFVP
ncbi:MAG: FAD-dependent monooxygenase, partial [Pseudomonadota bacterium]